MGKTRKPKRGGGRQGAAPSFTSPPPASEGKSDQVVSRMSRYADSSEKEGASDKFSGLLRHNQPKAYNKYTETMKLLQLDVEEEAFIERSTGYTTYPFLVDPYMAASGMTSHGGMRGAGQPQGGLGGFHPSMYGGMPPHMMAQLMHGGGASIGSHPGAIGANAFHGGYRHDQHWGGGVMQAQPARAAVGTAPAMQPGGWQEIEFDETVPMPAAVAAGGGYYAEAGPFHYMRPTVDNMAIRVNPSIREAYEKDAALNRVIANNAGGACFSVPENYGYAEGIDSGFVGINVAGRAGRPSAFDRNIALRKRPSVEPAQPGPAQQPPRPAPLWNETPPTENSEASGSGSEVIDLTKRRAKTKQAPKKPKAAAPPQAPKPSLRAVDNPEPVSQVQAAPAAPVNFKEVTRTQEPAPVAEPQQQETAEISKNSEADQAAASAPVSKVPQAEPQPQQQPVVQKVEKAAAASTAQTSTADAPAADVPEQAAAVTETVSEPVVRVEMTPEESKAEREMSWIYASHFTKPDMDAEDARFNGLLNRLQDMRSQIETTTKAQKREIAQKLGKERAPVEYAPHS